jgi:NAD-dependent deacetylase
VCARCGDRLRPQVVLFEEPVPAAPLAALERALPPRGADVALAVGTTAQFPYVQDPLRRARCLVVVDPGPVPAALADHPQLIHLRAPAVAALDALWTAFLVARLHGAHM